MRKLICYLFGHTSINLYRSRTTLQEFDPYYTYREITIWICERCGYRLETKEDNR